MAQENWVAVGALTDIPQNGARVVKTQFGNIGVFRTADDQIFAVEDRCPHLGGALSQGIVHGVQVTCPLHNWVIDLPTGQVTGADEGCTLSVPVRLEDGKILCDLEAFASHAAA